MKRKWGGNPSVAAPFMVRIGHAGHERMMRLAHDPLALMPQRLCQARICAIQARIDVVICAILARMGHLKTVDMCQNGIFRAAASHAAMLSKSAKQVAPDPDIRTK